MEVLAKRVMNILEVKNASEIHTTEFYECCPKGPDKIVNQLKKLYREMEVGFYGSIAKMEYLNSQVRFRMLPANIFIEVLLHQREEFADGKASDFEGESGGRGGEYG